MPVEIGETLHVQTAGAWRAWLEANAQHKREIWLITYKKGASGRSLDYESVLDEAACFGWIDSTVKGIDAERYAMRMSPRRRGGNWTDANLARVQRLVSEGRMTPAGLAHLPAPQPQRAVRRGR